MESNRQADRTLAGWISSSPGLTGRLLRSAFLGTAVLFLPFSPLPLAADQDDEVGRDVLIPQDDEAEDLLRRADELASSGDAVAAAGIYRRLLEEKGHRVLGPVDGVYSGVVPLVEDRLRTLSEEGRKAYSLGVQSKAAHLLKEALAAGSRSGVARVAERYLFSGPGEEACRQIGDVAFEAGEIGRALRYYRRILKRYDDPSEVPEEIGVRILEAERHQREPAEAMPAVSITPGGLRWECEGPTGSEQVFRRRYPYSSRGRGRYGMQSRTYFHPSLPVVRDQVVYIPGPTTLKAVDLEWGRNTVRRFRPSRLTNFREDNPQALYTVALDGDRLFGSFVTDVKEGEVFRGLGGGVRIDIKEEIPIRKVMSFDTKTGRKLWDLGDSRDPFLRRASFPAPPTAGKGVVYTGAVLMEGYVQAHLCALNARNGQLLWRTLIGSGHVETTMFVYPAREPFGAPVTEEGGILYYGTSLGLVAAVRAEDGAILWETLYETIPVEPARDYQPVMRKIGWGNSAPVVVDDVVVVAPLDSEYLYGFDRESGSVRWRLHRVQSPRGSRWNLRFILGKHGGNVLVSGDSAAAIRGRDGKVIWIGPNVTDEAYGMEPAGRGAILRDELVVPAETSGVGYLFTIHLRTGKATGDPIRFKGTTRLGNLLPGSETILLAVRGKVKAFRNGAARPAPSGK